MSDFLQHECGIAYIRLLKPLEFYLSKYGSSFYALNKLYLLMEKQHNRGQDGAGVACVKLNLRPGQRYINRMRSNSGSPIKDLFHDIYKPFEKYQEQHTSRLKDPSFLKTNEEFVGEVYIGHVRYGTFGKNDINTVHPFIRANNWMTRNLVVAGNFNMTNVDELFQSLVEFGQHPVETSDTITILEKIGHFLDSANEELYEDFKKEGYSKNEISTLIADNLNVQEILEKSAKRWDGAYVIAGMFGHGDSFIMRDPCGIRPAFYYADDEIVVAASERPVIQTALNVDINDVKELDPGTALIVKNNGQYSVERFKEADNIKPCSFERIYFSRGTDRDIYLERKKLGKLLAPQILDTIEYDFENSVFSYIPNTASVAFRGLAEELVRFCNDVKKDKLLQLEDKNDATKVEQILKLTPRIEKVAVKDAKLRTFITQDNARDDLVAHVYDVTYGIIRGGKDRLVIVDDSIVRGTTLKKSIIKILSRLNPKEIIVVSSAPQIRYPDCYGIDMAKLSDLIAFRAAIELLHDTHQSHIINKVYNLAKKQEHLPKEDIFNPVKEIYKPFSPQQISDKIAEMISNKDSNTKVKVIYQTIENLHAAIPRHQGDWYFTGNYPTPGGMKVVNKSFINYIEGRNERAY